MNNKTNKIKIKMTYDEYGTLNEIVRIRESDFIDGRLDKNLESMEKQRKKQTIGWSHIPYDLELTFKIDLDDFFLMRKAIRRYRHSDENLCLAFWYIIEIDELLQSMRKQHKKQIELWKPIWKENKIKREEESEKWVEENDKKIWNAGIGMFESILEGNNIEIWPNQTEDLNFYEERIMFKNKEVLFKLKSEKGKTVFKSYSTLTDALEGLEHAIKTEKQDDFYIKVEFKKIKED